MTNAEITLQNAIDNRNAGKLTKWEIDFVNQFENYTKKDLRNLTRKQYKTLNDISNK